MKKQYALFPLLAMVLLILDSRTASFAALEGTELVLKTAVPALFPFFVLSAILVPYSAQYPIPGLASLLGVPSGWDAVFVLGCLGGYPVGAQCVALGYGSKQLRKQDAERMLGFCTNCGPSFLFGIVAASFQNPQFPFALFVIGILSALLTGAYWPGSSETPASKPNIPPVTLPQAVQTGLRSMASVSAWIILGRILLRFMEKYLLFLLPESIRLTAAGFLELTNGCLLLNQFPDRFRFLAASSFTTFGGLCVWMQVKSICAKYGLTAASYLPQKLTQSTVAAALALIYTNTPGIHPVRLAVVIACAVIALFSKKTVEIFKPMVYNGPN